MVHPGSVGRVVVVGSGIVGASAAFRLAADSADVILLDHAAVGAATGAGAGILATVGSRPTVPDVAAFRFAASRHYLEIIRICQDAGLDGHSYAPVGQLTVAVDSREAADLRPLFDRASELVQRFGEATVGRPELLSAAEVGTRFPLLAPVEGGVWLPEVARVDGRAVRDALLVLARTAGAVGSTSSALSLDVRADRVRGVRTTGGPVEADAVVVAAGAWSGALVPGFADRIQPQRGQLVHLQLPGSEVLPALVTFAGHYLLPFPGNRVVIGATRETGSGFAAELTAGGLAQVLAQGRSLVPTLAEARWVEARVGLRPVSHDGQPYLGPVPGIEGLWLATGMGPSGLTIGPYSGTLIAEQISAWSAGRPLPSLPTAFDPGR